MKRFLSLVLLLSLSVLAYAEDPDLTAPPTIAHEDGAGPREAESLEGEVTIVQGRDAVYEEYRRNGRLYMVKVTPNQGYPYYLVDSDGDGTLEFQRSDIGGGLLIPHWILFSW